MNISKQEVMSLRFKNDMNMLQLICSEESIAILDFVRAKFSNDKTSKQKLAQHRDKYIGSQAIHLAAATGNRYIIEVLMLDFESDPYELTVGNQTVIHCAAQRYEGVLSIFLFNRLHNIPVTHVDRKGATPLHFATANLLQKNVQALIKLGAEVDARDSKGNTCLHLCISTLAEKAKFRERDQYISPTRASDYSADKDDEEERIYDETFEKLKDIGKELLFSGASR